MIQGTEEVPTQQDLR